MYLVAGHATLTAFAIATTLVGSVASVWHPHQPRQVTFIGGLLAGDTVPTASKL
jgi:hypothetical protein